MRGPSRNSSKACKFTFAGFVAIVLLALCPLILVAQMPNGTILGVVKDSSVAVVPGNNVTIRILETDQTRTAATETNGECRIPALPVGQDEIKAKHSDLSTKKTGLKLELSEQAVIDFVLQVAGTQQLATVRREARR